MLTHDAQELILTPRSDDLLNVQGTPVSDSAPFICDEHSVRPGLTRQSVEYVIIL
jgi:hypothetical protein